MILIACGPASTTWVFRERTFAHNPTTHGADREIRQTLVLQIDGDRVQMRARNVGLPENEACETGYTGWMRKTGPRSLVF